MTPAAHVVLVRPWTDAHAGGGCCGGEIGGGVCRVQPVGGHQPASSEVRLVGETYRLLREQLPEVDVQVVGSGNTGYLLLATFRALRRERGLLSAARGAIASTTAGAVLVDGVRVGRLDELGPEGVVAAVQARRPARA